MAPAPFRTFVRGEYSMKTNGVNGAGLPPWNRYGLRENPYFTGELTEGKLDLFEGDSRKDLAQRLVDLVVAEASPFLLLEGTPGVGKTSLINYARHQIDQEGSHYTYPFAIELGRDTTREQVAAEYLCAITTAAKTGDPDHPWEKDPRWSETLDFFTDTWRSHADGAGVSFAGFGANLSLTHVRQMAKHIPWESWNLLLRNLMEAIRERRRGVFIHLNNIDAVSDEDPAAVRRIFDECRDLLRVPGLQTVLCASPDFRKQVIADRQRLLDVIYPLGDLLPLQESEFMNLLNARYERFAIGPKKQALRPLTFDAFALLYEMFEGDIRNTFLVATRAVMEASRSQSTPEEMGSPEYFPLIHAWVQAEYDRLTTQQKKIVDHLVVHAVADSQAALQKGTGIPQPTISNTTPHLEHRRWIRTVNLGRTTRYQLSGYGGLYVAVNEYLDWPGGRPQ